MSLKAAISKLMFFTLIVSGPLWASWQSPPEQFSSSGAGFTPDVAANSSGNALAVWVDNSVVKASNFAHGVWGASSTISTDTGTNSASKVAFDDSGNGLTLWIASSTQNTVQSSFFNGTGWSAPFGNPLDTGSNSFQSPAIAMDGAGNGLAGWIELTSNQVKASTYASGFWHVATAIGTGDGALAIAYNKNDAGVAIWTNSGAVTANNFISGTWQTATVIGEAGDIAPGVGIDSNGHVYAIWLLTTTGTVQSSIFNGTSWSTSQSLSVGENNTNPAIAVAPGGTAVATWIDSSSKLQSSIYNGTSWSTPTLISASPLAQQADVAMSAEGDAIVLWAGSGSNTITSASLPLGGSWSFQSTVGNFANPPTQVVAAFSSNGAGFGVWIESQDAFGAFNLGLIAPSPPAAIAGKVVVNKFAAQTDRLHVIYFAPSTDPSVQFYRLKRNGIQIAKISSHGPYNYTDHDRSSKNVDVYKLTAVNAGGRDSTSLTIKLK